MNKVYKYLNNEEEKQIVEDYKNGVEVHTLMEKIGCHSRNVVYRILRKFNIKMRKPVSYKDYFKKEDKINHWIILDNIPIVLNYKSCQMLAWKVKCDCIHETESIVAGYRLRNGDSKSCVKCSRFNRESPLMLEGTEIPLWKINKFIGQNNGNQYIFECECKKCGNIKIFTTNMIRKNRIPNCEKCTPHYHENTVIRQFWRRVVNTASRCNRIFTVSLEFGLKLLQSQHGLCNMSSEPIGFSDSPKHKSKTTASLDRIDSSKGYTKDNVQWLHKDINRMKLEFTVERFVYLCRKIYLTFENKYEDYSI